MYSFYLEYRRSNSDAALLLLKHALYERVRDHIAEDSLSLPFFQEEEIMEQVSFDIFTEVLAGTTYNSAYELEVAVQESYKEARANAVSYLEGNSLLLTTKKVDLNKLTSIVPTVAAILECVIDKHGFAGRYIVHCIINHDTTLAGYLEGDYLLLHNKVRERIEELIYG